MAPSGAPFVYCSLLKGTYALNGFCYGAWHSIGKSHIKVSVVKPLRRARGARVSQGFAVRGAACTGMDHREKEGRFVRGLGTQAPVLRSVRARQRECRATGVRQTHARTQKRPAPYAVSSSSARLQQGHVGRGGRGTVSVAVPVWQHLAEHGSSCSVVFQFPLRLLQPRGESESEGAGGGRNEGRSQGQADQPGVVVDSAVDSSCGDEAEALRPRQFTGDSCWRWNGECGTGHWWR